MYHELNRTFRYPKLIHAKHRSAQVFFAERLPQHSYALAVSSQYPVLNRLERVEMSANRVVCGVEVLERENWLSYHDVLFTFLRCQIVAGGPYLCVMCISIKL